MSTNTPQPTESQPTTRPTPADAPSADATPTEATPDPDTAESWVARCRSQFDARRTDHLPNFADETNEATP